MAGTKAGGLKARDANLKKDPNFYSRVGAIGGRNGRTGGFASSVRGKDGLSGYERARIAGARKSRRRKVVVE